MKRLLAKVPKGRPKKGAPEGQLSKDQCTRLADLPDWLPSPVREFVLWAEEAWQRDENALAVLRRIATTPKMEVVWDTLKKRRASDSALRDFVRCACKYALLHGHKIFPMISRQERDASAKQFSDAVGLELHDSLPAAPSSQRPPRSWRTILKHVHDFQRSLQSPLVVENHIKDDEIRAYVQILGAETKELFGNVLRGTVATVASIALDRTVSERQVRNWCGEFEQVPPLLVLPQEVATYALASDPLLSADICERR